MNNSQIKQTESSNKTLYERDFAYWAEEMAQKLQAKSFQELDIDNLVEEIRDLSKRERDKLLNSIRLILHHLLKWNYIELSLEDSPSLKKYFTQEYLNKMYCNALLDAIKETG